VPRIFLRNADFIAKINQLIILRLRLFAALCIIVRIKTAKKAARQTESIIPHSESVRGTILKTEFKKGVYMIKICAAIELKTLRLSHLLEKMPTL